MIDTTDIAASFDRDAVRSAAKVTLIGIWLVLVLALVRLVPGGDYLVPSSAVTALTVGTAAVTVVVAAALMALASPVAAHVRERVTSVPTLAEEVAAVAYWWMVLLAIIVAHRGLAGLLRPITGRLAWTYDLLFLGLSILPVLAMAVRLYRTLDPLASLLAERMVETRDGDRAAR